MTLRRRERIHLSAATEGVPAVECEDLTKSFGPVVACDEVCLTVDRGEILALLGPSGCGKTTFLRLVAGFERPDDGCVRIGGRMVAGPGTYMPPERRRIGVVFQDYALFPHLDVAHNIGFGLGRRRRSRVDEALALVGLGGLGARYPHELSGGQQQRVALARALAPEPDLILLDEPFSNLDATLREHVRSEVREILRAAEATAIFVTHDQEEALSLADRVAIMRAGRVHQVDTPERIYTRPADLFVAAFVGGANLVSGHGDGGFTTSALGRFRTLNPPPDGPVTLVVRPETLRLHPRAGADAVVRSATFYGHDQVVEVAMQDGTLVRARLGPGRFFEAGDHVEVTVVGDEVLAFDTAATPT